MFDSEVKIIDMESKNFPKKLKDIKKKPVKSLYYIGNEKLFDNTIIGIVGSRSPDDYGINSCKRFAKELSEKGITIISGLAIGIDTVAHINSYKNCGRTIGVLASGFNNIYPRENIRLAEQILKNYGLLVSEYPPDEKVKMDRFQNRNRIISGLSDGVLVIQAKIRSGSMITARHAVNQEKPLFCIPGNLDSSLSGGTNKLIYDGANLVTRPTDITEYINFNEKEDDEILSEEQKNVLYSIGTIPISKDELFDKLNIEFSKFNEILMYLDLYGKIINLPGGKIVINKKRKSDNFEEYL